MNLQNKEYISQLLSQPEFSEIATSSDFYFQKGQEALEKWQVLSLSEDKTKKLLSLSKEYQQLVLEANFNPELNSTLQYFYSVISYCDSKAKDKDHFNKYDDKRTLARAGVYMGNWLNQLIQFKYTPDNLKLGSPLNAFNYLLSPQSGITVLSENHRKQISENVMEMDYNSESFVKDLKTYFDQFNIKISNPDNYTHLISRILYSCKSEWFDSVIALVASDGTGWQEEYVEESKNHEGLVIWNSKKPSDTANSLKDLKAIITENGFFYFYYSSKYIVNYRAKVIDFAVDQKELNEKGWNNDRDIYVYHDNFADYRDGKKSAKIVFLAESIEKIEPTSMNLFETYNNRSWPTQDNITPLKSVPEEIESIEVEPTKNMKPNITPKFPLNQILYGPPGTGKTFSTINKALEIIGDNLDGLTRKDIKDIFKKRLKEGRIVFTTFHQSMSYEEFIEGIKPIEPKAGETHVTYEVVDGIFKSLCKRKSIFKIGEMIGNYKVLSISPEIITLIKPNGSHLPLAFSMLNALLAYLKEKNISINDFNDKLNLNNDDKDNFPELELYLINGYVNIIPSLLKKIQENEETLLQTEVLKR